MDSHFLCHRAFHSVKGLSHKGIKTGVVFGFLKSISFFKDLFQTDRVAFCFEHPHLYRRDVFPSYKHKRGKDKTPSEVKAYQELAIQISELRQRYLPTIGFKNIFCFRGMEADDIMAAIALGASLDEEVILITSDMDLLQCLRPNVSIYSPHVHKQLTWEWFLSTYSFPPSKWAIVKAIAGCHGDQVPGVGGVGEKTAVRWLRGELKLDSKAAQIINSGPGRAVVRRNRALVQLPYKGCQLPKLQDDAITKKAWIETCSLLGMRSLAGSLPLVARALTKL